MPKKCIGNSLSNIENENDTSLFVQKYSLRVIYIESNIDEDLDLKNQY